MKLGFLGCGNMGTAILDGMISKEIVSETIWVANKEKKKNEVLAEKYGVQTTEKAAELQECDVVILGIKPQGLEELKFVPKEGAIIISFLAGTPVSRLREKFPSARIVRTMPNLGQLAGKGMTGIFLDPDSGFEEAEIELVTSIFTAGGEVLQLDIEEKIDWIGAISGSGPAYFFAFAEALIAAAINLGFSLEEALLLVRQTLIGSSEVVEKFSETTLSEWKQKVMSPKGTTEQAILSFEKSKLDLIMKHAVGAAMQRTKEMGKE